MNQPLPPRPTPRRPLRPTAPIANQSDLFATAADIRPAAPRPAAIAADPPASPPGQRGPGIGGLGSGGFGGLGGLSRSRSDEDDGAPAADDAPAGPRYDDDDPGDPAPVRLAGLGGLSGLSRRDEQAEAQEAPSAPAPAPAAQGPVLEEIKAKVIRIIKAEEDYRIYLVQQKGVEFSVSAGTATTVEVGDYIRARGTWSSYKGRQTFRAAIVFEHLPQDAKGFVAWIKTGAVLGVGGRTAEKIAEIFGAETLIAAADPERLIAAGIDKEKSIAIATTWNTSSLQPQLIAYLGGLGLGESAMSKIIKRYGMSARQLIDERPWDLADTIDGIGFQTADRIALKNGHRPTSVPRVRAGIRQALKDAIALQGHCGLPLEELATRARRLLNLPHYQVWAEIKNTVSDDKVIYSEETKLATPTGVHRAETELVEHFARLLGEPAFTVAEAQEAIAASEVRMDLKLDPSQRDAALTALTNAVSIITGGPGTGKSTTQKVIVDVLKTFKRDVVLGAPTGRAAKRLSEVSGMPASTCHRLLQWQAEIGGFAHDCDNPFEENWFVLDEVSMVDVRLAWSFIQAIPTGAGLTIVGDVDQLPSVGPGQVLRDLISSGAIPTSRLTTIHRQGKDSGIITAAHRINAGLHPQADLDERMRGFQIDERFGTEEIIKRVVDLMHRILPERGFDPLKDIQVLVSQRKGDVGVEALNLALKAAINPAKDDGNSITIKNRTWSVGDRIMHIKNDYAKGVFNGEVGFVTRAGMRRAEDSDKLEAYFKADYSGVEASYTGKDVDDVEQCWAATVHKSQGAEFPIVILVTPEAHSFMLSRNLLYTGVTRAKGHVILVGDHQTIQSAAEKVDTMQRYTGLATHLANHDFSPAMGPELVLGQDHGATPETFDHDELEPEGPFLRMDDF